MKGGPQTDTIQTIFTSGGMTGRLGNILGDPQNTKQRQVDKPKSKFQNKDILSF